jgi:hypothetical protein
VVRTRLSHDRVATGDATLKRKRMPTVFQGHMLQRDETKNRKCTICGTKTMVICGCGGAICSSTGVVTCWAWHLEAVASGAADEAPVQWQRDKQSEKWLKLVKCRVYDVLCRAWVVQWPLGSVKLPGERLPCSACSYLKWPLCIQITSILPGLQLIQSQNKSCGLKENVMNSVGSIIHDWNSFCVGEEFLLTEL